MGTPRQQGADRERSQRPDDHPTIDVTVQKGRWHLTAMSMKAFDYIYKHHYDDADWFMKADDDSYVILENLRYLLSSQSTSDPVYFGHHYKWNIPQKSQLHRHQRNLSINQLMFYVGARNVCHHQKFTVGKRVDNIILYPATRYPSSGKACR